MRLRFKLSMCYILCCNIFEKKVFLRVTFLEKVEYIGVYQIYNAFDNVKLSFCVNVL